MKLPHLDGWNAARRAHAARYRELLPAGLRTPRGAAESPASTTCSRSGSGDRDAAARAARRGRRRRPASTTPPAVARQPALAAFARAAGELPEADAWAREELSLPMFPGLAEDEVERVATAVAAALSGELLEVA